MDEEGNVVEGNNLNVGFIFEGELLFFLFDLILLGCIVRWLLKFVLELVKKNIILGLKGVMLVKILFVEVKKFVEMMFLGSFVMVLFIVEWDGKLVGNGMFCFIILLGFIDDVLVLFFVYCLFFFLVCVKFLKSI